MNYAFLKNFTFDGKETSHLFQIAKVTIPFLSKENELLQVGNSNGSTFLNTRRSTNTIQIDGFMIKDNSGMNIYDTKDELVRIINTNEPKPLIFDMFPNRYFNAIYSGTQEYDATDSKYTPLTLTFDVPDGLAHNINPSSYTNVYSTNKNLVLDSEYRHIGKYLKPWVYLVDDKYNGSNIVSADFTDGLPVNFERPDDWDTERWFNFSPMSLRRLPELVKGSSIFYGISVKVDLIDNDDTGEYSGQIVLEEWDTKQSRILYRHPIYIDKEVTSDFTRISNIITIQDERTDGLLLNYGFYGKNIIEFSQPMVSFLPPIGETVTAPTVGAKAYSNSLDFGDYDYSGNPNLLPILDYSKLSRSKDTIQNPPAYVKDHGTYFEVDMGDPSAAGISRNVFLPLLTRLQKGKTYTISANIMLSDEIIIGKCPMYYAVYRDRPTSETIRPVALYPTNDNKGKFMRVSKTFTTPSDMTDGAFAPFLEWYFPEDTVGKYYVGYDIKLEEGSTATPYQPNLLDAPYYLSKTPLGENLVTNAKFPITTPNNPVSGFDISEELIIGETYTVSLKGTKPANKEFHLYY